jgi:predicted PurR-regulated permease PerM
LNEKPIDRSRVDRGALGNRGRRFALNFDFSARWFWTALVVLVSAWIIHGFFQPLAWAAMLAAATWPIYRRFSVWMPSRMATSATPAIFTLLVLTFVLAPMVFALGAVAVQTQSLLDELALADKVGLATPAWLESLPWVGARISERWGVLLGTPGGLSSWVRDSSAFLGWVSTLGQFVAHHLFVISFSVIFLHFAYRDGDKLVVRLDHLLRGQIGDSVAPYLELLVRAVRAMVVSMVAVALFSGILTGIIFAIAGVKHAAVWGAVTGLFAMIPYLGYVVVAGVACSLAVGGTLTSGLVVFLLGCTVHFVGDKIVRPILVGSAAELGFVWVLMGSLGGLGLMGLLGVLLGPIVLALASSLWRQRVHDHERSGAGRTQADQRSGEGEALREARDLGSRH